MIFRTLQKGEEEAVARVAHAAFRVGVAPAGESDHAHWQRYYEQNPHVMGGETVIAEENGKIVGAATALRFEMSLGGVDVPMRGFAAVVVPPEARRRKIADQIMRDSVGRLRAQGDALSLLHPFRMSFYRKFGFAAVEQVDLLRASPRQLPDSPHRARVRPWDPDRDLSALKKIYDAHRTADVLGAGMLKRTDFWWTGRVLRTKPDVVVFEDDDGPSGYAIYEVPRAPDYPRQECHVSELVVRAPAAMRGLLGYFRAMEDQYRVIQIGLPRGRALAVLLDHGAVDLARVSPNDTIGYAQTSNMASLIDVPKALALHPLPARRGARTKVGLDVHDPLENKPISYDVEFEAGAHAKPGTSSTQRLSLSADRLAQIYFGAAKATDLLANGFIEGDATAAANLDAALCGLVTFAGPLNHF